MRGIIYRFGITLKQLGENTRAGALIVLGVFIKDIASRIGK
jgi:hypothetical protein